MFFIGSFSWQKHLKSKEKVRPTSLSYISYFSHPQAKSPPRVLRDKDQSGVIRQPQRPEPYTVRKQPFPEKKKASHPIAEQVAGLAQMTSSSPSSLLPIFLHHLFLPTFLSNFYPPKKKIASHPIAVLFHSGLSSPIQQRHVGKSVVSSLSCCRYPSV